MAAILEPNGAGASGQQPAGIVAQYQSDAIGGTTGVKPYDSGTILGTVPPGKAGLKLISGVIQRASCLLSDSTAGNCGNALLAVSGTGLVPTPPTGSQPADGLSQAPNTE